jgi:STE24 endopeptidase
MWMKWLFVGWVLLKTLTTVYLKFINLRYSRQSGAVIPEELKDVITEESHEKSKRYLADNTRYSIMQELFHAGITVVLVLLFAPWLEARVMVWTDGYWMQGLIFFAVLFLVDYILSLPFKIYDTFVLEQSHGFNRTSPKTFLVDELKGLLLGAILGGALLYGILYVIQFPVWWWRFALSDLSCHLADSVGGSGLDYALAVSFEPFARGGVEKNRSRTLLCDLGFPSSKWW